jgi:hypothetical protein
MKKTNIYRKKFMRPSKFIIVKGKKALFLFPGFSCLTWKGYAYCKKQEDADKINSTPNIDSRLESHETIHIRQAESMNDSWFRFYARYVWDYICNLPLIFINIYAPYKFAPIEMEAYMYQDDWNYCMHGKVYRWKDFEELSLKDRYKLAKEYYGSKFRPYITYFLQQKFGKKNED